MTTARFATMAAAAGVKRSPGDLEIVRGVSLGVGGIAQAQLARQDYANVLQLAQQALVALAPAERGANTDPAVLGNKAYYLWLIGRACQGQKNWKEAVAAYQKRVDLLLGLAMRTRLAADETSLSGALVDLGQAWGLSGDAARADAQYELASDAVTRALAVDPNDVNAIDQGMRVLT